jgi:class 3 adenylate cyclase
MAQAHFRAVRNPICPLFVVRVNSSGNCTSDPTPITLGWTFFEECAVTYQPEPIDTSRVALPAGLQELLEKLARHNHDIWAKRRIEEGWQYGPNRDDARKSHPCLVPYEVLPESEKAYDRQTSAEAIKAILSEGYRIEPPRSERSEADSAQLLDDIGQAGRNPGRLQALWQSRGERPAEWLGSSAPFCEIARRFLSIGAPLVALEVITEGIQGFEHDIHLRQLQGLALARTGAPERAQKILQSVREELEKQSGAIEHRILEETLGILARTYKDLALLAANENERQNHLRSSLELYHAAYESTGHRYWTGINVATLATLLRDKDLAQQTAQEVRERCLEELEKTAMADGNRYWILATLGEAALNLRNLAEAESFYRQAATCGEGRYGDLNSTRRQARLLLTYLKEDERLAERWLPIPGVAVFSGHMIDQPGRLKPRFPERFASAVENTLRDWLKENNIRIGFSSAACGSDLLFQKVLHELGGECHVVLPYEEQEFVKDSVDITGNPQWKSLFREVLENAAQVVYASSQKMQAGSVSYDYANLVLHGLATVRASELETEPLGLVVWNGAQGDGPGGTASVVARWHGLGVSVSRVDLSVLSDPVPDRLPIIVEPPGSTVGLGGIPTIGETEVMAMLFADAVNFGKLTEEQVPKFVQEFLGSIATIVTKYGEANVVRNTWGDGLYLVFKTVRDAGICALELREMVQETDWDDKGLPEALTLRIALHAGPVFGGIDPVTGNRNYTGTHVSRAARLEPKTPPGEVYASEGFAALVAVDKVNPKTEFACEYVKQLEWAKHYGTFPTYVVRKGPFLKYKDVVLEKA